MKARPFLIFSLLCLLLPTTSFAQDIVQLRVSERDGYSRLILGWKENVKYKVDKSQSGKLLVTFERSATLNSSTSDFAKLDNVASVETLSLEPLKIIFTIPKTSNVRDFKIGNRVVFDVYDPKDKDEKYIDEKYIDEKENLKAKAKVLKDAPPTKKVQKKIKQAVLKKEKLKPMPPTIVLVPEKLPIKKPVKKQAATPLIEPVNKKLDKAIKDDNHVISMRSVESLQIAAFENYGDLWVIVGGDSGFSPPSLSSPQSHLFSEFRLYKEGDIRSYQISLPKQHLNMKAKGGGLSWDLIMGDKVKELQPIKTKWSSSSKTSLRSGTLFMALENIVDVVDVNDSVTGQKLKVALVSDVSENAAPMLSYIDFDILRSPIGLAVRPKVDDLKVVIVEGGIEISRPNGLAVSSVKDMGEARMFLERASKKQISEVRGTKGEVEGDSNKEDDNFFRFNEWAMGSSAELNQNENILLSGMRDKSDARRVEDLLTLGKMFLSHGRGAEALGYFNYAQSELPDLLKSSEFRALRGLSKALSWKSDAALEDFILTGLEDHNEIKYWKSYVLADLGDWQQAASILPDDYKPIYDYPDQIGNRLALVLAEVNLRDGKVAKAEELLALLGNRRDTLFDPQKASLKYLRGEANRQNGNIDKSKRIWKSLGEDKDDLYRTKSRLALAILLENSGDIKNEEVIDRLERLRYAWRGDELEAQINYLLGKAYFKNNNFVKGLAIMRDGASVAGDIALGHRITDHMAKAFSDFYLKRGMEDVSALDAITLYEQFSELTPVGSEGDKLVQRLAEHMVRADLLGRATKLLRHQVSHRLKGIDKLRVAIRLAAIELIDKNPQQAMNALGTASSVLNFISDKEVKGKFINEIALLKIRAYSQNKQFDKALSLIENMPVDQNVNRLKADIAWQANYWEEAANALDAVIIDENISMTRPLSKDQQDLILNRAIALSLANDRIALANMRKKFSDLMLQTNKAHQFEVITRPRHSSALADRETLLSIVSEVDLFKNFLDSYRDSLPATNSGKALN